MQKLKPGSQAPYSRSSYMLCLFQLIVGCRELSDTIQLHDCCVYLAADVGSYPTLVSWLATVGVTFT